MFKCCVLGLGYIGLPTAAILAKSGYDVLGVDVDKKKVELINNGFIYFKEPNLDILVTEVVNKKKLVASHKISNADIFIIAVPTPFIKSESGIPKPDLSFIENASIAIAEVLEEGNTVILESTIPVGTTKRMAELILEKSNLKKSQIKFAHCPERVLPGRILEEIIHNNRVVGGLSRDDSEFVKDFYQTFCKGEVTVTDANTAEMVKLSENSFRDVNIAYANELSILCDKFEINVAELIMLANKHPRVNILSPSCGVGGHCIAVDPWFLVNSDKENTNLIRTAREVNLNKTTWVTNKIINKICLMESLSKKRISVGCFGITFKPDIDDCRESPALKIINNLISMGYQILICEPNIKNFKNLSILEANQVVQKSDLLIFLVAHNEFKNINTKGKEIINLCSLNLNT